MPFKEERRPEREHEESLPDYPWFQDGMLYPWFRNGMDPDGMYTGVPMIPGEIPVQDADDL